MSTPSFRTRNLDSNRAVYVYRFDEEPREEDLHQLSSCSASLPTGMEKDEETRALTAQQQFGTAKALQIPIPLVKDVGAVYDSAYPPQFHLPQNLIHLQLITDDADFPAYDMDSDDESFFLDKLRRFPDLSRVDFEGIITKLEENSGQKNLISFEAALMILKLSRDIVFLVYNYWVNKRERKGRSLMLQVASEKDCATNPYVAFRKRVEKMQTRKNRKVDEFYYQKMFRLRKEFDKALRLIHMLKNREKLKHQMVLNLSQTSRAMFAAKDYQHLLSSYEKMCRKIAQCYSSSPIASAPKRQKEGPLDGVSEEDSDDINLLPPRLVTKTVFREVRPLPPKDSLDCEFTFQRKRGCRYYAPLRRYGEAAEGRSGQRGPSRFRRGLVDEVVGRNRRPMVNQSEICVECDVDCLSREVDNLSVHGCADFLADDLSKFC